MVETCATDADADAHPPPPPPLHDNALAAAEALAIDATAAPSSRTHARRPTFHPSASDGFCSDPAGPVFWRGWYHLFFQHHCASCQWHWGLGWAHMASRDLVRWVRLPPALLPGPDQAALDADGCFSGSAAVDHLGTGWPTLLYTGVFLKDNEAAAAEHGTTPPHGAEPYTRFRETQLAAVPEALLRVLREEGEGEGGDDEEQAAHASDPLLVRWSKLPEPVVRWPPSPLESGLPPGRKIACWRDPWLVCGAVGGVGAGGARPSLEECGSSALSSPAAPSSPPPPPTLLLCSGMVDLETDAPMGGAVLAFAAPDGLTKPWRCLGLAAEHADADDDDDKDKEGCVLPGRDWEMPRVAWIPLQHGEDNDDQQQNAGLHALVMSPDACDQPPVYALGRWDAHAARFDLRQASGPTRLDLGRSYYAATVFEQPAGVSRGGTGTQRGRTLMWGWLQEHRPEVPPPPALTREFSHAGCLSVPRVLTLVPASGVEDDEEVHSASSCSLDPCKFRIFQEPLPELERLRSPVARWSAAPSMLLRPGAAPLRVGVVAGPSASSSATTTTPAAVIQGTHLDIEAEFELLLPASLEGDDDEEPPPQDSPAASVVAIAFRSWRHDGAGAAVLTYHWRSGMLEVAFDDPQPTAYDERPFAPSAELCEHRRRVGGRLERPPACASGAPVLKLRLLLDGSSLEVFTGGGEVLSTRVYRGEPPTLLMEEDEKEQAPPSSSSSSSSSSIGAVLGPATPTRSPGGHRTSGEEQDQEEGGGGAAPAAAASVAAASAAAAPAAPASRGPCYCTCGIEVFASGGAPVLVRRLEAWEMLPGCLDPAVAVEEQDPTPAEIARAAIAAVDAAEREVARLAAQAAELTAAAAAPMVEKDAPASPPPTRVPSMLAIPTAAAVVVGAEVATPAAAAAAGAPPMTPELSPAFLRALDLGDAAREEDARQAAEAAVVANGRQ